MSVDQVDLIVCYDASASPIRNIQRMGRTGRHRQGRVVCILSAGLEQQNYHKNLDVSPLTLSCPAAVPCA